MERNMENIIEVQETSKSILSQTYLLMEEMTRKGMEGYTYRYALLVTEVGSIRYKTMIERMDFGGYSRCSLQNVNEGNGGFRGW
mmetsp:Transcript_19951/g.27695  ORF Transcript_19951/g.27695 Transcript_19951/m.27695 type:complete len:84 (-) Transcript_19951:2-253(-)